MRKPSSGAAGWWLAATKSFGIAPRSRTGCIPFFRLFVEAELGSHVLAR